MFCSALFRLRRNYSPNEKKKECFVGEAAMKKFLTKLFSRKGNGFFCRSPGNNQAYQPELAFIRWRKTLRRKHRSVSHMLILATACASKPFLCVQSGR